MGVLVHAMKTSYRLMTVGYNGVYAQNSVRASADMKCIKYNYHNSCVDVFHKSKSSESVRL